MPPEAAPPVEAAEGRLLLGPGRQRILHKLNKNPIGISYIELMKPYPYQNDVIYRFGTGVCHDGVELKIYVIRYVIAYTVMGNCHRIRHCHMSLRVIVCNICHDDMSLSTQKKLVVMTNPNMS